MAETEEKKEAKSIEETFGELDILAQKAGGFGIHLWKNLSVSTDREWSFLRI